MRFDEMLSGRNQAAQTREPIEYPKYIQIDGKPVLVHDAEDEAARLAEAASAEAKGSEEVSPDDKKEDGSAKREDLSSNLLSQSEKRGPGRPRKPVNDSEG